VRELLAPAKLNLALVVGPARPDGRHQVATVLQRVSLADRIRLEPAAELRIDGFVEDTLVRRALEALAAVAGREPRWRVEIDKQIPVAAGLGGGSSDAGAALRLANETLPQPLPDDALHRLAAQLGADVPFFLTTGPQLGEEDGTVLEPVVLTQDYWILILAPDGERKESTAAVYEAFRGEDRFEERRAQLLRALALGDLAALPGNDLASSPLTEELQSLGAFRADVSGAGPALYGLFAEQSEALAAHAALGDRGQVWIAAPAW
jgi:4-diphosphocytidyl-2-C-methyl-D-erythritol kinase